MEPEMSFTFWFKSTNGYRQITMDVPSLSDKTYFYKLKLKVVLELGNIRNDIVKLLGNKNRAKLIKPRVDDKNKQKILDKLVKIRKDNNKVKELLQAVLADEDFLICEHCKHKMYKIPINVSYEKYGNSYIIKEERMPFRIKYIFGCSNDNCHFCIEEEPYRVTQNNLKLRRELLAKGKTFVPNEAGFWHKIEK